MPAVNLYGLRGILADTIDSTTTVIEVDAALAGVLAQNLSLPTYYTYLSISAGSYFELVKVTAVNGNYLVVDRAVGIGNFAFPAGARVQFEVTAEAILDGIGVPPTLALTGSGLAEVSNPSTNVFEVSVAEPNINGEGGIQILGTWPNLSVTLQPRDCCGGDAAGESGGFQSIQGQGIINAYASGTEAYVSLPPPNFEGVGITITGSWPNFTFTAESAAGGTVTSVQAGAGITITGAPSVSPTVAITNTGVAAGTYGGMTINARGQITAVAAGFAPISAVEASLPLSTNRTGNTVNVTIADAAIGVKGAVALADHTDPFDPNDSTNAATPAVVAAALDTIEQPALTGSDSFTSEADGAYTNTIGATATPLVLAAGQKALVMAHATVLDGTTPGTPLAFGIAVFDANPVKVKANKSIAQISQHLMFTMTGPVNTTLVLATTDLTGGSLQSYGLHILKL